MCLLVMLGSLRLFSKAGFNPSTGGAWFAFERVRFLLHLRGWGDADGVLWASQRGGYR